MAAPSVSIAFSRVAVERAATRTIESGMYRLAATYANTVKRLMRDSPASGRRYGRHRASAPGEPPAPNTGRLVQSIRWQVTHDRRVWVASVSTNVKYALYLEYGAARGVTHARGRNKGRIRAVRWVLYPRPAWAPALALIRPRAAAIITGKDRGDAA